MANQTRRDVFQAISDPTRRDILTLLTRKELNLNGIAEKFEMSRPAISQQIKILTECGLVEVRQQGRQRFCYIQPQKMKEVSDWLEPFKELWERRFTQMEGLLNELQAKNKDK